MSAWMRVLPRLALAGPGDPKTIRATFKVPKGAKKVAITLAGVGTFDDVDLAP